MSSSSSLKIAIFICENKSYPIYVIDPQILIEEDPFMKYTFAMLKNPEGQVILKFLDHHPSYETYGSTFSTQFLGFLDEPKEIICQKKRITDQMTSYNIHYFKKVSLSLPK